MPGPGLNMHPTSEMKSLESLSLSNKVKVVATFAILLGFSCTSVAAAASSPADKTIPTIDIAALVNSSSSQDERRKVAKEIGRACEDIGFFAVINHGVDPSVIDQTWRVTTDFFDLPPEEKMAVLSSDAEYPYGYEQSENLSAGKASQKRGREYLVDEDVSCENSNADETTCTPTSTYGEGRDNHFTSPPDLKETFSVGPSDPEKSGMPARRFPPKPEQMDEIYEAYYNAMLRLSMILLQAFALALDLDEEWFEDKMDRHMCALRALNYPDLGDVEPQPGQLRAGAHSDYGALTILKSGGPGLQVSKDMDAGVIDWVNAPYLPDAFIINLGDLMQRWTNDKWKSTLHRVIVPKRDGKDHRRQSIAFFVNVNGDAEIEPIESCVDEQHPQKYGKITAFEHLMKKHLASMGVDDAVL